MNHMQHPLYGILNPRSVCVMGASNQIHRMGTWSLLNILGSGFKGPVYVVHPEGNRIQDVPAYKSLDELPEAPELLVLVIPTPIVPQVLEQAGRRGIRHAVIITAGYEETGEDGRMLQKKIDAAVAEFGIHYIGPNCIGFVNPGRRINTTPFPFEGRSGGIGFASHSGSYVCHALPLIEDLDMGIREMISLGNEGNLDVVDALEYFGRHPDVRAVGLYLEGIRRPDAFKKAALRLVRKKPVVALYGGNTPEGARAAATHTASLACSGELMHGFLRQCGIIQAQTTIELYEWLNAFERQPLPKGPRMAVLSNSGGPATSMSDHIGQSTLQLPRFSENLIRQLAKLMPHTGSCRNPIDLTFSPDPSVFVDKLPAILSAADEVDGILVYGVFGADLFTRLIERAKGPQTPEFTKLMFEMADIQSDTMAQAFRDSGKPVLAASFNMRNDKSVQRLMRKWNIPFHNTPERAVRSMEALWRYARIREGLLSQPHSG